MVSTSTETPVPGILVTLSYLILRAVIALSILVALTLLSIKHSSLTSSERVLLFTIIGTGLVHWIVVGTVFNSESRYAVFSSICLLVAILYVFQNLLGQNSLVSYLAITILLLTWIGSWSPSDLRSEGPDWSTEFTKAEIQCAQGAKYGEINTTPINQTWQVKVDCHYVIKKP